MEQDKRAIRAYHDVSICLMFQSFAFTHVHFLRLSQFARQKSTCHCTRFIDRMCMKRVEQYVRVDGMLSMVVACVFAVIALIFMFGHMNPCTNVKQSLPRSFTITTTKHQHRSSSERKDTCQTIERASDTSRSRSTNDSMPTDTRMRLSVMPRRTRSSCAKLA